MTRIAQVERPPHERPVERWYGCYGGRGDWFLRASNVHPAKMAVGLCARIFEHGQQRGYWKPGDTILDPMSGIGTTAVVGGALGYNIIAVELEPRFVALLKENLAYVAARRFHRKVRIEVLEGDAREICALLARNDGAEVAGGGRDGIITSPPYL